MDNSLDIKFSINMSSAMRAIKKIENDLNKIPHKVSQTLRDLLPPSVKSTLKILTFGGIVGLIMSSPRLFGAMAKISIELQLLSWAVGKHFRPILDAVAVLLNAIRTNNWDEVKENIVVIYNKTKDVIYNLYNKWKEFVSNGITGISDIKEIINTVFVDLNTRLYNYLPDWLKMYYDQIYNVMITIKNKKYISALKMIFIDPLIWVFSKIIDIITIDHSTVQSNIQISIDKYKNRIREIIKFALDLTRNFKIIGKYIWLFSNIAMKLKMNKVSNIFINAINTITGLTEPKKITKIDISDMDKMFGDEPISSFNTTLPYFSYTLATGKKINGLNLDELNYIHSLNMLYSDQNTKINEIKDNFNNTRNMYDDLAAINIEMVGNVFYPQGINTAIYYMKEPRTATDWFWKYGFYPTVNGPWGVSFRNKTNSAVDNWFFQQWYSFHFFLTAWKERSKKYTSTWYMYMKDDPSYYLHFDRSRRSLLNADWVSWNADVPGKPSYQTGGTIPATDYYNLHKGERIINTIKPKIDKVKINFKSNIEIHNMDITEFSDKLTDKLINGVI